MPSWHGQEHLHLDFTFGKIEYMRVYCMKKLIATDSRKLHCVDKVLHNTADAVQNECTCRCQQSTGKLLSYAFFWVIPRQEGMK
jgi:hypothetical protein